MTIKYYYIIYQFIMFLYACSKLEFLLGLVGIPADDFLLPVGMKNGTNARSKDTHNGSAIHYQRFIVFILPLLDCWAVGTKKHPQP